MKEIWKDIDEYVGIYQISNNGRIKSLERVLPPDGVHSKLRRKERIVKGRKDRAGYVGFSFSKDGVKSRTYSVHRLVAKYFIPNPENKSDVNHKNGDKADNCVNNLEWATRGENQSHAYATGLKKPSKSTRGGKWDKRSKNVVQVFKNGKTKLWHSCGEAARALGLSRGNICSVCNGKVPRCGGFKWRYV